MEAVLDTPDTVPSVEHLTLVQAARGIRPGLHPATLTRYILRGAPLPDGTRVKLRAVRCGSKWLTKREWITEFLNAQTAPRIHQPAAIDSRPPAAPAPIQGAKSYEAAVAELERMGV